MLTEWLKGNYNVKRFGEPTWQWLVDAVGDPAGGEYMGLARDIASRHKPRGMSERFAVSHCEHNLLYLDFSLYTQLAINH